MVNHSRRRVMRWVGVSAVMTAVIVGAWGIGIGSSSAAVSASAASGLPFRVLGFFGTSGTFAVPAGEELDGLKAAASVINAQGGILHHRVVITVENDQNTGTTAVSEAQQVLASGTAYNMIVPGIDGADAIPLAAVLARTPSLQISPAAESALNQPQKYPNLFMSLNNFPANEQSVVAELKKKHITKIAFISGDDPSGINAQQALSNAARAAGITVTASVLVPDTATDAKSQLQQALASNPQAIVTGAYTGATPTIMLARAQLGSVVPFYTDAFSAALPLQLFFKTPAELGSVVVQQFPYLVDRSSQQHTSWWRAFFGAFHPLDPQPALNLIAGSTPYNALMLARAAAVKAGSIKGPAMAKALATITTAAAVPGFVGAPDTELFSARNHQMAVGQAQFAFYKGGPTVNGLLASTPAP